jgi:AhpD family alkylhydroperoxidase
MKKTLAALATMAALTLASFATAEDSSRPAVAGAITNGVVIESTLDPKVKSLIAVGVAAQISCQDCLFDATNAAKANGATDAELIEAVTRAAGVRLQSLAFNAAELDL